MKQVWLLMTIRCSSKAEAAERAQTVERSSKTKNVVVEGTVVKYEQLTWKDGYDKENLND
tara:strand:+ start:376 stop:555 length:180 start_codon:yes stop_codon:yes gene_type:complete